MTDGAAPYRVLITCGVFEPGFRGGGPVRAIANTIDTLPPGVTALLITRDRDVGSTVAYPGLSGKWVDRGRARVFYLDPSKPTHWWRLFRELRRYHFDLLYANSMWAPVTTVVPVLAAVLRVVRCRRILLAPRGELAVGALSLKAGKKRLVLPAWGAVLRRAKVQWHATTALDGADIRRAFPWAPIVTVDDPVLLPSEPLAPTRAPDEVPRLVYLSRIARIKGLHLAAAALRHVDTPLNLDVYGPIEDENYWRTCLEIIERLPSAVRVVYRGEVRPEQVRDTFARYDASILPTAGENFGYVIAESLSAACPVICSAATPWSKTLRTGGGWVAEDPLEDSLIGVLRAFARMSPAARTAARAGAAQSYRGWRSLGDASNIISVMADPASESAEDCCRWQR